MPWCVGWVEAGSDGGRGQLGGLHRHPQVGVVAAVETERTGGGGGRDSKGQMPDGGMGVVGGEFREIDGWGSP